MRPPSFNLSLDVPVPSLVRTSHGLPVDPQVLNKQPPAISAALAEILNTPDAGKLLLGLNELFGSASEYAIGGSVALALHHRSITDSTARRPNDLDVVVSPSAMDRLSDLDHQGLSQLGFKSEPGNTESLSWAGQGRTTPGSTPGPACGARRRRLRRIRSRATLPLSQSIRQSPRSVPRTVMANESSALNVPCPVLVICQCPGRKRRRKTSE